MAHHASSTHWSIVHVRPWKRRMPMCSSGTLCLVRVANVGQVYQSGSTCTLEDEFANPSSSRFQTKDYQFGCHDVVVMT